MIVARKNFLLTGRNFGTDPRLKVGRDPTAPAGLRGREREVLGGGGGGIGRVGRQRKRAHRGVCVCVCVCVWSGELRWVGIEGWGLLTLCVTPPNRCSHLQLLVAR